MQQHIPPILWSFWKSIITNTTCIDTQLPQLDQYLPVSIYGVRQVWENPFLILLWGKWWQRNHWHLNGVSTLQIIPGMSYKKSKDLLLFSFRFSINFIVQVMLCSREADIKTGYYGKFLQNVQLVLLILF